MGVPLSRRPGVREAASVGAAARGAAQSASGCSAPPGLQGPAAAAAEPAAAERDTEEPEDAGLASLLLPPSSHAATGTAPALPSGFRKFSVAYNMGALSGWVKQPSPCCAAASMAGAWNAVLGLPREHPAALGHRQLLEALASVVAEQLAQKQEAFESHLGCALQPVLDELLARLADGGTPLGSKQAPAKKGLVRVVRQIVAEEAAPSASNEAVAADADGPQGGTAAEAAGAGAAAPGEPPAPSGHERLRKLFAAEAVEEEGSTPKGPPEAEDGEAPEPHLLGAAGVEAAAEAEAEAEVSLEELADRPGSHEHKGGEVLEFDLGPARGRGRGRRRKRGRALAGRSRPPAGEDGEAPPAGASAEEGAEGAGAWWERTWAWRADLEDILHTMGGLAKLRHPEKPNTAYVGNPCMTAAGARLQDCGGGAAAGRDSGGAAGLDVAPLMGRKGRREGAGFVALSASDGSQAREAAWSALRAAFMAPQTALIFHLTNHYALIFSLREWEEDLHSEEDDEHPADEAAHLEDATAAAVVAGAAVPAAAPSGGRAAAAAAGGPPRGRRRTRMVRQMLTARKGQRPSAWLDFEAAVQIMLGWEGYKILRVRPAGFGG